MEPIETRLRGRCDPILDGSPGAPERRPSAVAVLQGVAARAAALVAALAMLLATASSGLGQHDAGARPPPTETSAAGANAAGVPALLGPEFSVAPGPDTGTDRAIYRAVRSQLFWSPFVNADQVTVDVTGGVVTLTGTVDSPREREAAAANAHDAGAVLVRNDLAVERARR